MPTAVPAPAPASIITVAISPVARPGAAAPGAPPAPRASPAASAKPGPKVVLSGAITPPKPVPAADVAPVIQIIPAPAPRGPPKAAAASPAAPASNGRARPDKAAHPAEALAAAASLPPRQNSSSNSQGGGRASSAVKVVMPTASEHDDRRAASPPRAAKPAPIPAAAAKPAPTPAAAAPPAPVRRVEVPQPLPPATAPRPRPMMVPTAVQATGRGPSRFVANDVDVPPSLMDWASSQEAATLLSEVKESSHGVESISFRSVRQGRAHVHIEGLSMSAVRTAAAVVNLHLKNQLDLLEMRERADRAESDLQAAEEELRLGLRCEFPIDPEVYGLAIGKNGANIARALETGVARVVVDKMEGVVRIRGSDPDAVFRAREIMEFQVLRIPIKSSEVPIIRGHDGSNLADIQSSAGVIGMVIEPVTTGGNTTIVITGQKTCVDAAKLLIDTQLKYARDLQSARSRESAVVDRLKKLDLDYGDRPAEYARADDRGSRRSERIEPRAAAPPPAAPAPAPSVSRGGAASGTFSRGGAARGGRGGRS